MNLVGQVEHDSSAVADSGCGLDPLLEATGYHQANEGFLMSVPWDRLEGVVAAFGQGKGPKRRPALGAPVEPLGREQRHRRRLAGGHAHRTCIVCRIRIHRGSPCRTFTTTLRPRAVSSATKTRGKRSVTGESRSRADSP